VTIDWPGEAACHGATHIFFPAENTGRSAVKSSDQAKAICAGCPVRDACLEDAIARNEPDGIWGGLTAPERYRLVHGRTRGRRRIEHGTADGIAAHPRRGDTPCAACQEAMAREDGAA
jgi:WhiB family redox-sensing transcriptional regulator